MSKSFPFGKQNDQFLYTSFIYAEVYKNDHFVSRMGKILTFFPDRDRKMGNPLISRTGKIPHCLNSLTTTDTLS